jgi:RimJ/RimL family protein N-acetyltransferase
MATSILQGSLVVLRAFEPEDDAALHEILGDPRLGGRRHLSYKRDPWIAPSRQQTTAVREDWAAREAGMCLAACESDSGEVVGYGMAGWSWNPLCPWINVVVAPDRWREGIGSETAGLLLDFLFGTTVAHVVSATADAWNDEGAAFATALGFQPAGRYRRNGIKDGRFVDSLGFDILRPEWLASGRSRL